MTQQQPRTQQRPRVLLVDDEPLMAELFDDVVRHQLPAEMLCAPSLEEARRILARENVDLLVLDVNLPDGDGLSLLPDLKKQLSAPETVIISGRPDVRAAIVALRNGAVDFLPKPFSAQQITDRLRCALDQRHLKQKRQRRMDTLKNAVRRLNQSRKTINKKVDLLCQDLISAYGVLARQMETVRVQQGFRQFLDRSSGLEQLLCNTMDWLLRQVGHCNIGIWLTTAEQELQLGAYMKYTIPAERELTEAMEHNLLRAGIRRGLLRLRDGQLQATLTPTELKHLSGQDIIACNCSYLGESLGAIALFRDVRTPFSDDDVSAIKTMAPLFSLALAQSVRDSAPGGEGETPGQSAIEDAPESTDQPPRRRPRKKDPADWWKTGEAPPF